MEIMGVQIRTIVRDNVATRCDGCLGIIEGTPWRVNLLDIVAAEAPVAWTQRPTPFGTTVPTGPELGRQREGAVARAASVSAASKGASSQAPS